MSYGCLPLTLATVWRLRTVEASRAFVNAAEASSPHGTIRIWAHLSARLAASGARISFTREIQTRMNHGAQLTIQPQDPSRGQIIIPAATAIIKSSRP